MLGRPCAPPMRVGNDAACHVEGLGRQLVAPVRAGLEPKAFDLDVRVPAALDDFNRKAGWPKDPPGQRRQHQRQAQPGQREARTEGGSEHWHATIVQAGHTRGGRLLRATPRWGSGGSGAPGLRRRLRTAWRWTPPTARVRPSSPAAIPSRRHGGRPSRRLRAGPRGGASDGRRSARQRSGCGPRARCRRDRGRSSRGAGGWPPSAWAADSRPAPPVRRRRHGRSCGWRSRSRHRGGRCALQPPPSSRHSRARSAAAPACPRAGTGRSCGPGRATGPATRGRRWSSRSPAWCCAARSA
mmetsp:Transcript_37227/g.64983  ORF Transcript_37227/g.64983 Transcript_37227/m.64983 type:complete len:298 (-) Transcript_37227:687-1580(-)